MAKLSKKLAGEISALINGLSVYNTMITNDIAREDPAAASQAMRWYDQNANALMELGIYVRTYESSFDPVDWARLGERK